MGFEEEFSTDSTKLLRKVLLRYAAKLTDNINTFNRGSEEWKAYYGYLKDFLINSGILCDDIVEAVKNDKVLLAMIGTRTLLEDAINVHYLQSKADQTERVAVAIDWFRITNNPEAHKNKIDGKTVEQRAIASGLNVKALYDDEYVEFCNYTHSTGHRVMLNLKEQRSLLAKNTVLGSLKAYANIVTCVADIIGEQPPQDIVDSVKSYFDKY